MLDDNAETRDVGENVKTFPVDLRSEPRTESDRSLNNAARHAKTFSVDLRSEPRTESDRSLNNAGRQAATFPLTSQNQEKLNTPTYVAEQNLIRSNSWIEANIHSKITVKPT